MVQQAKEGLLDPEMVKEFFAMLAQGKRAA
jgi:hypothetical protein